MNDEFKTHKANFMVLANKAHEVLNIVKAKEQGKYQGENDTEISDKLCWLAYDVIKSCYWADMNAFEQSNKAFSAPLLAELFCNTPEGKLQFVDLMYDRQAENEKRLLATFEGAVTIPFKSLSLIDQSLCIGLLMKQIHNDIQREQVRLDQIMKQKDEERQTRQDIFDNSMSELRVAHDNVVKQIANLAVKVGKNQFEGGRLMVSIGKMFYESHTMEWIVVDENNLEEFWLADKDLNYYESRDIFDMYILRNLFQKLNLMDKK